MESSWHQKRKRNKWQSPIHWALILGVGVIGAGRLEAQTSERPNFIVIIADDLGYGDLSCYQGWIETPHLDDLASSGLRFTDFHSNGSVCSPTRAALFTGRYQQRAGIPGVIVADPSGPTHNDGLADAEWTLAEALGSAGYVTGLFGKWHLGYRPPFNPTRHGFDSFRGYISGNVDYFSHIDQAGQVDWWHGTELEPDEGYTTELITRYGVEFIERNRAESFLLVLAHEAPHYPFQGPGDEALRRPGEPGPVQGQRTDKRAAYREMVQALDQGVGEIVQTLDRLELRHKTMVWFVSDNGAAAHGSNAPWRGRKGTVWEGGHRVPSIVSWPGVVAANREAQDLCMTFDIMPTLLELSHVAVKDGIKLDGQSLTGILKNDTPEARLDSTPRHLIWNGKAVRRGQWKLILPAEAPSDRLDNSAQLFDLDSDPGETQNLAEQNPDRVKDLNGLLQAWKADMLKTAVEQPSQR